MSWDPERLFFKEGDLGRCSKFVHKHPTAKESREGEAERVSHRGSAVSLKNVDVEIASCFFL